MVEAGLKQRSLLDVNSEFEAIKDSSVSAVKALFPIVGKSRSVHLDDAWVDDNQDSDDLKGQLQAKLEERTWAVPLMAKVHIKDSSGHVVDRQTVRLADIPKPTPRLGYIVGGQEYQIDRQWRLKPGIYSRVKDNGELESHINTAGGDRISLDFDPTRRKFNMVYGGSTIPLYPVLGALGAGDVELKKAWGPEILEANSHDNQERALKKLYKAATGKESTSHSEATRFAKEFLTGKVLSPEVTETTIGMASSRLDAPTLTAASKTLLSIARGDREPDDRDALPFKQLHTTEDFIHEKINVFSNAIKRRLANAADKGLPVDQVVYPGLLDKAVSSVFTDTTLSRVPTQDNPLEFLEGHTKTTILGQGGISNERMVTEESRSVSPTQLGYMDPVDTPEGQRVGISGHLALGASKAGHEVFTPVYDIKTRKMGSIAPSEFVKSNVALPDSVDWSGPVGHQHPVFRGKSVRVVGPGNTIQDIPSGKIDFVMPSSVTMFSAATNLIPFLQNDSGARVGMADRHLNQAVPLKYREPALVQVQTKEGDPPVIDVLGALASHRSTVAGTVSKIGRGSIKIKDAAGKEHEVQIYDHFPLNDKKSGIHSEPIVAVGDHVKKDQVIADSAFSRNGQLALGANMRVGYIPIPSKTFEDSIVISEGAAKRLTSLHLHRHTFQPDENTRVGKSTYAAYYPTRFNRDQLGKLDNDGVVMEGQQVNMGDPLSVSLHKQVFTTEAQAMAKLKRSLVKPYADAAVEWDSSTPGKVVRVHKLGDGRAKVFVSTEEPAQIADKLSGSHGNKGTIGEIRPDAEMPHTKDGKPIEIALNPYGVPSRLNPGQIFELAAGKIAEKTGKPYLVQNFTPDVDYGEKLKNELKQHGIEDTEELIDPQTGLSLGRALVGPVHIIKQRHQVERKISARSGGPGFAYDVDRQPRRGGHEGAQAIGGLGTLALLAHGSRNIIREAATLKSDLSQQDEMWRSIQFGQPLPPPKPTFVQKKFENYLNVLGVKLKKTGNQVHMVPMLDREVLHASSGEVEKPNLVLHGHNLEPETGGLFDPKTTGGLDGEKMAHIKLPEPIPNPFFERGVQALTGLTQTDIMEVLGGKKWVKDGSVIGKKETGAVTGGRAIGDILKSVDVKKELKEARDQLPRLTGQQLDRANKRLRYLEALDHEGLRPDEAYMTSVVSVLPPTMRPITVLPTGDLATDPLNETYKALGITVRSFKALDPGLPERSKGRLRKELYTSLAALQGVGAGYKRVQGGETQGIMDLFTQPTAKFAWVQSKMFKHRQDLSGRSVVVPDPDLGLDEIGLPHRIAAEVYKPFVIRELTRVGYSPLQAEQLIKKNDSTAEAALQRVSEQRPVLMKRDPVLHKYGIQAFKPRIDHGLSIKVPPLVTGGFNADFDGNCCVGVSKLALTVTPGGRRLTSTSAVRRLREVYGMKFAETSRVVFVNSKNVVVEAEIQNIPYLPETERKDRNGASVYNVPRGLEVLSAGLDGKGVRFSKITGLTIEEDAPVVQIRTRRGFEVTASTNESLCVFDHSTGKLAKVCPKDAKGSLVPIVGKMPTHDIAGNYEVGWMIGSFAADGFFMGSDGARFGYAKLSDAHRTRFSAAIDIFEKRPVKHNTYRDVPGADKLGRSAKDHYYGADRCSRLFQKCYAPGREEGERAALYKKLPSLYNLGESTLLGILAGLLDGDGSVSISHGKKKPQVMANYSTSSPHLVESLRKLCFLLGIRCSATPYEPKAGRLQKHTAYIFTFSVPDLANISPKLKLCDSEKMTILKTLETAEFRECRDAVPIPVEIVNLGASVVGPLGRCPLQATLVSVKSRLGDHPSLSRPSAQKLLNLLREKGIDVGDWADIVGNKDILWDVIEEVTPAGTARVFDLIVPETKVFSVNGGLIVWDTMSVFVPITDAAVKDAWKMLPSRNLLHPATGRPVYVPSNEMSLGLYRATTINEKPTHEFKTPEEVLAAVAQGKVRWETVKIGGKPTTVGRVRIWASMPDDMRTDDMLFDQKQVWNAKVTNSFLKELAEKKPQEYANTVQKITDLGSRNVFEDAFSLSVADFQADKKTRERVLGEARKEASKVLSDHSLTRKQKDEKVIDVWAEAGDRMEKEHWATNPTGGLAQMTLAGVKPSRDQYKQLMLAPMLMAGTKGKIIPSPVARSYSEGLDTAGFWVQSMAARRTMFQKTQEVREPGYLTKQVANTTADMVVVKDDCGTHDGISLSVDHPDVSGRYIAKPVNEGGIHLGHNDLITSQAVDHLRKAGVQSVIVRSALKCRLPQGICSKCAGTTPEGHAPEVGTNLGVIAGQAIGERSTQLLLRAFHQGGAIRKGGGAAAVSQFDRVDQLLRLPQQIPDSAVLAEEGGKVKHVHTDPAGGYRVVLDTGGGKELEHHVPGTSKLHSSVRVGAAMQAGSPLSSGNINMHDLLRTSGLEQVQNQIATELDDIYRPEGIRRRNIELITRGVTNLGTVEDPGDNHTLRRGDMTPLSVAWAWNDKKPEKPVKVRTVLKGVGFAPLDLTEDWMSKLHHERIKDTLVDAALEGHRSNVMGYNPFGVLASSPETFGIGDPHLPGSY